MLSVCQKVAGLHYRYVHYKWLCQRKYSICVIKEYKIWINMLKMLSDISFSVQMLLLKQEKYISKKTTTYISALLAMFFVKRIFAAVFCCVPNALFNPEFLLVQHTFLLLQVLQLILQLHQSVACPVVCIFSWHCTPYVEKAYVLFCKSYFATHSWHTSTLKCMQAGQG